MLAVKRVLISVSDKTNLEVFAKNLSGLGVQIISTGGSARFITSLGLQVKAVDEITGFPEMLDGRIKTLHPNIHAGLLALRHKSEHMQQLESVGIQPIDMIVVNLYPFKKTISKPGVEMAEAIENIDIGGPSMLRSAAKNYQSVAVVTSPLQYSDIIKELTGNNGCISDDMLARLAVEAFAITSEYDGHIKNYLKKSFRCSQDHPSETIFPDELSLSFDKVEDLRYGENEHQKAAFYKGLPSREPSIPSARQLHGKALSYNNIMDLDSALEVVKEFDEPASCIIKHATPCGIATAPTLTKAFTDALSADALSAFGGVIGFNRKVDVNTSEAILNAGFIECIIAPGYEQNALARLISKPNIRILSLESMEKYRNKDEFHLRKITGGILAQQRNLQGLDLSQIKIVTQKKPTPEEVETLIFAWKAVKHIKSNAITLAKGTRTIGIGAGQMSRVDSVFMSIHKAGEAARGSVLASDAFFPKQDAVELAIKAGIVSVIQPGGSKADDKIIEACNRHNISMVFTGIRHFRH